MTSALLEKRTVDIWIAASTAATALFALAAAVVAWLAYRHSRIEAGAFRPVTIGRRPGAPHLFPPFPWFEAYEYKQEEWYLFRVFDLYMLNRSGVRQTLTIDTFGGCRIFWPWSRSKWRPHFFGTEDIEFQPHQGGNVMLRLVSERDWPSDQKFDRYWYKQRYLIRLKAQTVSGHSAHYIGWVRLRPFEGPQTTSD